MTAFIEGDEVGILGSILGRRKARVVHRTVDGGHPAPYPDMTDEQLYNYEVAFNLPKRTFEKPPRAAGAARSGNKDAESASARAEGRARPRQEPRMREPFMTEPFELEFETTRPAVERTAEQAIERAARTSLRAPARAGKRPVDPVAARQAQQKESRPTMDAYAGRSDGPALRRSGAARMDQTARPAGACAFDRTASDLAQERDDIATEAPARSPRQAEPDALVRTTVAPGPANPPPLDFSRPVRTITTKQPVEIITTRARHPIYKVHAYIGEDEIATVFTIDGRLSENGPVFLENVHETRRLHLNVYPNPNPSAGEPYRLTQHASRDEADAAATRERIGCVMIEFNE